MTLRSNFSGEWWQMQCVLIPLPKACRMAWTTPMRRLLRCCRALPPCSRCAALAGSSAAIASHSRGSRKCALLPPSASSVPYPLYCTMPLSRSWRARSSSADCSARHHPNRCRSPSRPRAAGAQAAPRGHAPSRSRLVNAAAHQRWSWAGSIVPWTALGRLRRRRLPRLVSCDAGTSAAPRPS